MSEVLNSVRTFPKASAKLGTFSETAKFQTNIFLIIFIHTAQRIDYMMFSYIKFFQRMSLLKPATSQEAPPTLLPAGHTISLHLFLRTLKMKIHGEFLGIFVNFAMR